MTDKARIAHPAMLFQLHLENRDFARAAALKRAASLKRVMHLALDLFLVCFTNVYDYVFEAS